MAASDQRPVKSGLALVAIGVFKLLKCGLLCLLGISLVRWRNRDLGEAASEWLDAIWFIRPYCDNLIAKLSQMDERTIKHWATGAFIYAGLLLVEGVGLCLRKRWAEYLTVAITSSLLPLEFYELARRVTPVRVAVTLINLAIVVYLVVQLRRDRQHKESPAASAQMVRED